MVVCDVRLDCSCWRIDRRQNNRQYVVDSYDRLSISMVFVVLNVLSLTTFRLDHTCHQHSQPSLHSINPDSTKLPWGQRSEKIAKLSVKGREHHPFQIVALGNVLNELPSNVAKLVKRLGNQSTDTLVANFPGHTSNSSQQTTHHQVMTTLLRQQPCLEQVG